MCLLLTVCMLTSVCAFGVSAALTPDDVTPGFDYDGDGNVNVLDARAVLRVSSGIEAPAEGKNYDLDGDGCLDVIDASLMHNFINGFVTIDVYAVGDYDCNGKAYEEADITAIKHAIENPEVLSTSEKYASDINGDGKLSEEDLTELTAI